MSGEQAVALQGVLELAAGWRAGEKPWACEKRGRLVPSGAG